MLDKIIKFFKKEKTKAPEPRMTSSFVSPEAPSFGRRNKEIHIHHHHHYYKEEK